MTTQTEGRYKADMDHFSDSLFAKFNNNIELLGEMAQSEAVAYLAGFSALIVVVVYSTITFKQLVSVLPSFEKLFSIHLFAERDENGRANEDCRVALQNRSTELYPYFLRLRGAIDEVKELPADQQTVEAVRGALLRSVSLHNLFAAVDPDEQLDMTATFGIK